MRTVNAKKGSVLPLGRLGENEATVVVFDITEWTKCFGSGTFQLLNQRNGDTAPYPCEIVQTADRVSWRIKSADVSEVGYGKCELVLFVGDTIAKSEIWTTVVGTALTGGGDVPEPWEDWVQSVLEAGTAAQEAKTEWENMTAEAVELPAGSPPTAHYEDGVLTIGLPESRGGASTWDEVADKPFESLGNNLEVIGGKLNVQTAPNVEEDNTKPVTSAAVYVEVGNINALLELI